MHVGVNVKIDVSLTSTLHRGEWPATRFCRYIPQGKIPRYPLEPGQTPDILKTREFLTLRVFEILLYARAVAVTALSWFLGQ
jgi:hypothetical protein